jgi:hypothetical protein
MGSWRWLKLRFLGRHLSERRSRKDWTDPRAGKYQAVDIAIAVSPSDQFRTVRRSASLLVNAGANERLVDAVKGR